MRKAFPCVDVMMFTSCEMQAGMIVWCNYTPTQFLYTHAISQFDIPRDCPGWWRHTPDFFNYVIVIWGRLASMKHHKYASHSTWSWLTQWGWVTHTCVINLIIAYSEPNHYLDQCWNIIKWTLGNILRGNFNQSLFIFIQVNAFENVAWEMATILSRPQCVKINASNKL